MGEAFATVAKLLVFRISGSLMNVSIVLYVLSLDRIFAKVSKR